MPARSSEVRAHTRTTLQLLPGSIKYGSIPLSKLKPLVTNLYSEERIIRMGGKSFPKATLAASRIGVIAQNLFE